MKYDPEMCKIATQVLADGESLAAICSELGIVRSTLYEWRDNHPEFKAAIELGLQKAQRLWEGIGMAGVKGHYKNFSAPSWIFTMKNRFRDDYKEDKESKSPAESLVEKFLLGKLVE